MRLAGSIAIHVLLALLLATLVHRTHEAPLPAVAIEIVSPPAAPTPEQPLPARGGGGAASAREVAPAVQARQPTRGAHHAPRPDDDAALRGREVTQEGVGDRGGEGGAGGNGGAGHGHGLGFGSGHGLAELLPDERPVPAPPPPRISKARAAILVYPSRQTAVEDAQLYVAEITVDTDGFVAGAHLVRGLNGPRDGQAAGAIWRFRYSPALDDEGHPIQSTVQQKFAVAW